MSDPDGVNFKLTEVLGKLDTSNAHLAEIEAQITGIASNLGTYMINSLAVMEATETAAIAISSAIGTAGGGPTTTVAGLLAILQDQTRCAPLACPPGPDDPDGCIEPFVSSGQIESVDYPNRVFAQWLVGSLPTGVTEGSFLAHAVDDAQIVHAATIGWKAYVQSNGAGSCSINPDTGATIACNRWIGIDTFQDMSFSVPVGADITVYLCSPSDTPFVGCVNIISTETTYETDSGAPPPDFTEGLQAIFFNDISGIECADSMISGTSPTLLERFLDPCGILTNNANGWTFKLIGGSTPVIVIWTTPGGDRDFTNLNAVDDVVTITVDTAGVLICNAAVGSPTLHPFTIRVCDGTEE